MSSENINRIPVDRKLLARLFAKIKISETNFYNNCPCWEWQGCVDRDGYGLTNTNKRTYGTHRLFYQLFVEIIPSKQQQCDHLCKNRRCVNPAHIEIVSARVNTLRGNTRAYANSIKTHCPKGHPLFGDNVYKRRGRNVRECKICRAHSAAICYRKK